ncbi:E3 ubiquitin-protein ligase TRIM71-like [Antedon mediterranea]|uniref:E3 ubiquitin-protein ligase TRIM71-like n=1 Tax=Antedon mediterranea TaxID=105859 RepID=UPI003AF85B72
MKAEILQCGQCRVALKNSKDKLPTFLKCLHAFCGECITKIISDNPRCPICKASSYIQSDSTINDLPSINFLQNIEQFENIKQQIHQRKVKECQNCSDGNQATHLCTGRNMPLFFCNECVHIYNNFNKNGVKMFISLQNIRDDHILPYVRYSDDKPCQKHGEDVMRFCDDCLASCCPRCDHSGHNLVSLKDEADAIRRRIREKVQDAETSIGILQRRMEHVRLEKERLYESSKATAQNVNIFFDKLKESLDIRKKTLLSEVSKITHEKSTKLNAEEENTEAELNDIIPMTQVLSATSMFSNDRDIMGIAESLKTRSKDYISTRLREKPDVNGTISFGFGEFTDINGPLQFKRVDEMFNKIPMAVDKLGEVRSKETKTVASETTFRIREKGSGLDIVIDAYTKNQQPCKQGGDSFSIEIKDPNCQIFKPRLEDLNTGSYVTHFIPSVKGKYTMSINIQGKPIKKSPYTFTMDDPVEDSKYAPPNEEPDYVPRRDPPPPPVPSSPRPPIQRPNSGGGYITMNSIKLPHRQRSNTVNSMVPKNHSQDVDRFDIECYVGTRRGSRRGSDVYMTIDSLGLDVKEKDEKKLAAVYEQGVGAMNGTLKQSKSSIFRWKNLIK